MRLSANSTQLAQGLVSLAAIGPAQGVSHLKSVQIEIIQKRMDKIRMELDMEAMMKTNDKVLD